MHACHVGAISHDVKYIVCFLILLMFATTSSAQTGKVEAIQDMVQQGCSKKVAYEEALSLIRALYLTCVPGTKVTVYEKCLVKCLKLNSGVVIGR